MNKTSTETSGQARRLAHCRRPQCQAEPFNSPTSVSFPFRGYPMPSFSDTLFSLFLFTPPPLPPLPTLAGLGSSLSPCHEHSITRRGLPTLACLPIHLIQQRRAAPAFLPWLRRRLLRPFLVLDRPRRGGVCVGSARCCCGRLG